MAHTSLHILTPEEELQRQRETLPNFFAPQIPEQPGIAVRSPNKAKTKINEIQEDLDKFQIQTDEIQEEADKLTQAAQDKKETEKEEISLEDEFIKEEAKKTSIATGEGAKATGEKGEFVVNPVTGIVDFFPEGTPIIFPEQEQENAQKEANENAERRAEERGLELASFFNPLRARLDTSRKMQIDNIKSQFERMRVVQREANRRREKLQQTLNIRAGISRFTPGQAEDLVQEKVTEGLAKINQLNSQEAETISKIQSAFDTKSFNLAIDEFNALQEIRKNRNAEIQKIEESQIKQEKEIRNKTRLLTIDATVSNSLIRGITDPNEIFRNAIKSGVSVTSEEIFESIKNLVPSNKSASDLGVEFKLFEFSREQGWIPGDADIFDFWKKEREAKTSKSADRVGNGAGTPEDYEQFSQELLALSVLPTKLKDSEVEKQFLLQGIRAGLAQGKSVYEIVDTLMGYKIFDPSAFSEGIRKFISIADLDPARIPELARLINGKEYEKAISVIEDSVYAQARRIDPDNFTSEQAAVYAVKQIEQIEELLGKGFSDQIGPFEGLILGKAMRRLRPKEATDLMSKITQLTAKFQKQQAGTAMTESEYQRIIDPVIPSITDKAGAFFQKLDNIRTNALRELNAVRQAYELPIIDAEQLLDRKLRIPAYSSYSALDPMDINAQIEVKDPLNLGF